MALLATGCVHSGKTNPYISPECRAEFDRIVPKPQGTINQRKAFAVIAMLKQSESAKAACGKRVIATIEEQFK